MSNKQSTFFVKCFGLFSVSVKYLQNRSLTIVQNSHLSKLKQKLKNVDEVDL